MYRILHISDIHFGPPHRPRVAEGVLDLYRLRSPNLVVVSGDLTQRAKPTQFRQARQFVDQFSVPVITVPGNHDVPMYRCWERALVPYGAYRKYFDQDLEPTFQDSQVLVVGVNTAFGWTIENGRYTNRRLHEVENLLRDAPAGCCKIVVAHHPPIRPSELNNKNLVKKAKKAMDVFSVGGVDLLLSGHLHRSLIESSQIKFPNLEPEFVIALSGTTTSSRGRGLEAGKNSCNWIEISDHEIAITTLEWSMKANHFAASGEFSFPRQQRC